MELLLKELNTTDSQLGSIISHKFHDDKENLQQILTKYDMNTLYIVKNNVEKYQTEMLHELVRRRMNRLDNQVNTKAGYDVIEKCLDQIKQIMDNKVIYERKLTRELRVKEIQQQTNYLLVLLSIVTVLYILLRVLVVMILIKSSN
jgi:hypothetical protein